MLLAVGESAYIGYQVVLHRGMPTYWVTMPFLWPAVLALNVLSADFIPEEFIVVLTFFGMVLNNLVLILLFDAGRKWLRAVRRRQGNDVDGDARPK